MGAADYMTGRDAGLAGRYAGREMAAPDRAPAEEVKDASTAARAARLEDRGEAPVTQAARRRDRGGGQSA